MLRKLINLILSILILAAAAIGAQELINSREPLHSSPREDLGPLVSVHTLAAAGADITLNAQGTVRAKTILQLTSDVAGRITWVNPDLLVGTILDADTPIARVDKSQYQVAQAQANLALRDAELSLADAHTRFKTRNPRHPQIRRAEAEVEAAKAQIEKARIDLRRTEITLPVRALVDSKNVALGQYVAPGSVLAGLHAVDTVEVVLPLSLSELALLNLAASPEVSLSPVNPSASKPGATHATHWPGRLARINQQLDEETRIARAVIEVDEPYALTPPLRIGQFVNAAVEGIQLDGAFRLPINTLFDNRYVYRVLENTRLERVDVDILHQDAGSLVVRGANLNPGDALVLSRLDIMTDGMLVRVDNQE